jgi:MFS family permease
VIFLAEFAHGGLLLALLPQFGEEVLKVGLAVVGLCISLYYATELTLKVPAGMAADRLGHKALLVASLTCSALTLGIVSLARHPLALAAAVCLHGAAASAIWPSALAFITGRVPPEDRGAAMGAVFTGWLSGLGLGILTCIVLKSQPVALRFWVLGAAWALALVVAVLLVPRGRRVEEAEERLPQQSPIRLAWEVTRRLSRRPVLVLGLFAQTFSLGMLAPVLERYCTVCRSLSEWQVSTLMVGGGGLAVALMIPMGRLTDRFGKRRLLIAGLVIGGTAILSFPLIVSLPALVALVGVAGAAYAVVLPAWNAVLLRHVPADKRALMISSFMALEQCGMAMGPTVSGLLWEHVGRSVPFLTSGSIVLLVAIAYVLSPSVFKGEADTAPPEPEQAAVVEGAP